MANDIYSFGKFDKNDLKHLGLGAVVYGVLLFIMWYLQVKNILDLGLEPQYPALIGTFAVAYIWEFSQKWRAGARMDWKDVIVTSVPGIVATVLIEVL